MRRRRPRKIFASKKSLKKKLSFFSDRKRGIFAVIIFLLAGLSFLSYFHKAGPFGEIWLVVLLKLFGWQAYIIPALFALTAFFSLDPERYRFNKASYVGLVLLVVSLSGIMHLFYPLEDALEVASEGRGGGYLGFLLMWPTASFFSFWAALILFIAAFFIGLSLYTNLSFGALIRFLNHLKDKGQKQLQFWRAKKQDLHINVSENHKAEREGEKIKEAIKPLFKTKNIVSKKGGQEARAKDAEGEIKVKPDYTYKRPPFSLLNDLSTKPNSGDIKNNAKIIERTLANFGIKVTMGEVNVGPTVTQYTLKPDEGVKLSKITALHNDLSLALAAHPIRIEAPIPGKSLAGIEIPNKAIAIVRLRPLLEHPMFLSHSSPLVFALGEDVSGQPVYADLEKMPHLLISGATGSGKSICINSVIMSLIYRNSPKQLRFVLVDPKRVELSVYNNIPHLLTPVVTETEKTINVLRWAMTEMDRRFKLLSEAHKRNIHSYNATASEKLPLLVIIVDELADIMAKHANEVEGAIVRLAQMSRAVGIHLVVATQRPSVDVITGLVKANITSRICFNVASSVDSRTVLDISGGEKLLGNGDMLFLPHDVSKPKRVQGAYITEGEVKKVVEFLKKEGEAIYDEEILKPQVASGSILGGDEEIDDSLFNEAKEVVMQAGKGSASLLQRRLRVGYARAARLLDLLEEKGIVGPADGSKPREVIKESKENVLEEEGRGNDEDANFQ